MTADSRQSTTLPRLIAELRDAALAVAHDVAADLGEDVTAEAVEPVVRRFLGAISGAGARVGEADLVRSRTEGAVAARLGQPLAAPIDAYLSTAWVCWDHALRSSRGGDPAVLGALGAALLRAGDDIAAALADGYTAAERALASSAGATRQAILDELLTGGGLDPAAAARLTRRMAIVGFEPGAAHHVLVVRLGWDGDRGGEPVDGLVDDLARRLARDPGRRPYLVAARGADVVAIASPSGRGGVPFAEQLTDAGLDGPWWAVVDGPVPIEDMATAYADALDALRVVTVVGRPGEVVLVPDVALERALVADRVLAASGVARWLGPLEHADRGGPELVRTVEAWLAAGESVVPTSRVLRIAPRTVSYRLTRVARLLGVRTLDADVRARLSAAVLTRRLLGWAPDSEGGPGQLGSNR